MKFWMIVLLIFGLPLAFYLFARTTNVRFEARIEIETPTGIKTDSRVMNVSYTRPIFTAIAPMEARGGRWRVEGEALAVEVVPGRYLFVSIGSGYDSQDPVRWLIKTFRQPAFHKGINTHRRFGWMRAIKRSEGYFEVPATSYPYIVSFEDINDPASVFQVEPGELDRVFGPGISLKSFALTSVSKKVEIGRLQGLLPWLSKRKPSLCKPSYRTTGPLCGSLTFRDFLGIRN